MMLHSRSDLADLGLNFMKAVIEFDEFIILCSFLLAPFAVVLYLQNRNYLREARHLQHGSYQINDNFIPYSINISQAVIVLLNLNRIHEK